MASTTTKLKVVQILSLWNVINKIQDEKSKLPAKFSYALVRTKKYIEPEITSFEEAQKPSAEYIAFENERVDLCKKYAKKDESGQPVVLNGAKFDMVEETLPEFDAKFLELQEKYKDAIETRNAHIAKLNEILDEEREVTIHQISESELPESIETSVLEVILPMIAD